MSLSFMLLCHLIDRNNKEEQVLKIFEILLNLRSCLSCFYFNNYLVYFTEAMFVPKYKNNVMVLFQLQLIEEFEYHRDFMYEDILLIFHKLKLIKKY